MYLIESVSENDDKMAYAMTVQDVPVDPFWSVTVYNADGYLEANDLGVNSYNDITAESNPDGSCTITMADARTAGTIASQSHQAGTIWFACTARDRRFWMAHGLFQSQSRQNSQPVANIHLSECPFMATSRLILQENCCAPTAVQ
jgi:hypothetical protein